MRKSNTCVVSKIIINYSDHLLFNIMLDTLTNVKKKQNTILSSMSQIKNIYIN